MQDARKSLRVLREEWASCTRCELGPQRMSCEGELVTGEGSPRGLMFIGDGPGKDDETTGRPFFGDAGKILRRVLEKLGVPEYYVTNIVACRSCTPFTDAAGNVSMRKNYKTKQMEVSYRDEPPNPMQVASCLPRIQEEIYLVDPVVIVSLGTVATKALTRRNLSTLAQGVRGAAFHITIPGAGFQTVRTAKKDIWVRSQLGAITMPIETSDVRYLCIPTHDLGFVRSHLSDQGEKGPFREFVADIQKAMQVYERYMLELFGAAPSGAADTVQEFTTEEIEGPTYD